jgi:16S rRNA processing protein RimM
VRRENGKTFMVPMRPEAVPEWGEKIVIEAAWAE